MKKNSKMTLEQKKRLSEAHKGQIAWNKGKKTGKPAWNKGIPMRKELRKKISERNKGNKYHLGKLHSEETKRKISLAKKGQDFWTGRTHSEESKRKMSEAHKGKPATWNKGRIHSKETINKQREALKKTLSNPEARARLREAIKKAYSNPELRKKVSEIRKEKLASGKIKVWNKGLMGFRAGEKSHLWKGGITPINKKIRKSLFSRGWREAVFKRDNWTCCICKNRGEKLNAHHIKSFSKYPELRFVVENGITLCNECHRKTENYGKKGRFK